MQYREYLSFTLYEFEDSKVSRQSLNSPNSALTSFKRRARVNFALRLLLCFVEQDSFLPFHLIFLQTLALRVQQIYFLSWNTSAFHIPYQSLAAALASVGYCQSLSLLSDYDGSSVCTCVNLSNSEAILITEEKLQFLEV